MLKLSARSPEDEISVDGAAPLLLSRWKASRQPGRLLPSYEDVALGSLGQMAGSLAVISGNVADGFQIIRAGPIFESWLGVTGGSCAIDDVRPDCARTLQEILGAALATSQPAISLMHQITGGIVETYEVAVFPLASRWGPPLVLAFVRSREKRYSLVDMIFDATDEGMLALAAIRNTERQIVDFQIIALNEGAATLLHREKNALQWKWLSELDLDLDFADVRDRFVQALLSGARDQFEVTSPGERGARYLKISVSPINDLLAVTLTDIGDLKAREESFRLPFDSNPVPMWLFSPKTLGFMSVNDAALAHYGYSREQFLNMSALDIRPEEERDIAEAQLRSFNGAYHPDRDWRHLRSDGSEIQVLPYLRSLNFKDSPAILAAVFDVTDRRQAEARIAHMAHHDALTGLPNRVLFRERLDEALSRVRRHSEMLAVLCLDLDHFKSVNDTLGHPIGDLLLKAVARRLETCLREVDIVARLGGDEFAIIQSTGKGPQEASRLASRLVEEVSKPYDLDGHQVVIGVSIGIATAPSDGNTPDILLKNADMALYRAKADGRRTFCFFEPEMDARLQARRLLELDLRRALAAGEFELFYQPLVNVNSNAITGFEALLRWRHPQRGMVSPAEFIPLAEEIGLIVPLGEWVLRQACAQAATWPDTLSIAVNLSPVQFRSSNLVPAVVSALANSGLPAGRLELEITESVLLQESEGNLATLHQLRALGAHIAMDDFGTGYSSLGYLRSFPFDKIKIDQTFVRELDNNPDCIAIISAVTGLGARLGIRTLAEGVETQEQLEQLRAEGCTEVQGYLFSEPVPASDLRHLLEVCRRRERAA